MERFIVSAAVAATLSTAASARDDISIAGLSRELAFATIVAEDLGNNPNFKTPVVESGGSSVGEKGVCEGIGTEFIYIGNASSRMKSTELALCESNDINVTEIKVGYDGIVVANSKNEMLLNISKSDLGKALTAKVPGPDGNFVNNPYKNWSDVNPDLPNLLNRVYGPPTTSGTRASFAEMVNQKGYCKKDEAAKAALKAAGEKDKVCRAMRTDGAYIEAGEQDNLSVQKLQEDPSAFGIFGFSCLDQNSDTLQGAIISGTKPTFELIAKGEYPVSRALYFYVRHAHIGVVPGVKEYMTEWTKPWGEDGLLSDAGMIPMQVTEREYYLNAMNDLPILTADMLK